MCLVGSNQVPGALLSQMDNPDLWKPVGFGEGGLVAASLHKNKLGLFSPASSLAMNTSCVFHMHMWHEMSHQILALRS